MGLTWIPVPPCLQHSPMLLSENKSWLPGGNTQSEEPRTFLQQSAVATQNLLISADRARKPSISPKVHRVFTFMPGCIKLLGPPTSVILDGQFPGLFQLLSLSAHHWRERSGCVQWPDHPKGLEQCLAGDTGCYVMLSDCAFDSWQIQDGQWISW